MSSTLFGVSSVGRTAGHQAEGRNAARIDDPFGAGFEGGGQ